MELPAKPVERSTQQRNPIRARGRILRMATALFAEHGPNATSVNQIAQRAGYNKRMVYHYFGSKGGLYLAVLQEVYGRIKDIALDAISHSTSPAQILDAIVEEYFLFLQQNPEFVALLNWENSHGAVGLHKIDLGDFITPISSHLRQAMEAQRGGAEVSEMEVRHTIISFLAMCGYYFSNRKTMSIVFKTDLSEPDQMSAWLDHVKQLVRLSAGIKPNNNGA